VTFRIHLKPREELVPSRGLNYTEIRLLAHEIGDGLWQRCKRGEISKIGIDEIRAAILERAGSFRFEHPNGAEHLEKLTALRIVEKVK
jgi:hypothetical protein